MVAYMITDGKGAYIRKDFSGRYTPVRNEALADTWDSKVKAQNILRSQINKNMRKRYKIVERKFEASTAPSPALPQEKDIQNKGQKVKEISNEVTDDTQIDKWEQGINSFNDFVINMEERKEQLSKDLSNVDKEITDIHHYIELGSFNAYQGWVAFSMLRSRLKRRRKIKNEFQVLSQIGECKINSAMIADMQTAIHKLSDMHYTPRVLTGLFE